jgi:methyl-accepting chemotaxis protein
MNDRSEFSQRQLRTKNLIILAAGVIFILLMNGVLTLFALHTFNQRHVANVRTLSLTMDALESARNAQVHFKKQVQEWKNILLRGGDKNNFDRYLVAFTSEEEAVQNQLETVEGFGKKIGLDLSTSQIREKHRELSRHYRAALRNYKNEDPQSMFSVDNQVRGIDRAPTDAMDGLVVKIRARENELTAAIGRETEAHYQNWRKIAITGTIAGIVLVSTMLWLSFAGIKQ